MNPPESLRDLVRAAKDLGASDLHIKASSPPLVRLGGSLSRLDDYPALSASESESLALSLLVSSTQRETFERSMEIDISHDYEGLGRVRANLFRQKGTVGAVLRLVSDQILTLEQLGLPEVLADISLRPRGLLLVTGPSGSGKSTSQAALIDHINKNLAVHIITAEDPIEYCHAEVKAVINQREIGTDTKDFSSAVKYALRQDPDVILIGELNSTETMTQAVTAAETGHLVIGTLHTPEAVRAVDRIIDSFPSQQQYQVRQQLSGNLLAVLAQRLVPGVLPGSMEAAFEMLVVTPAISGLIRDGKSHQVRSLIQTGGSKGMHTLEQHLALLVKEGRVELQQALNIANSRNELLGLVS